MVQVQSEPVEVVITGPGLLTGSGPALERVARVCAENRLGMTRPSRVLLIADPQKTHLYFLPVHRTSEPGAIPVTYTENRFTIDLGHLLDRLKRPIPPGYKETYSWEATVNPVTIGETTGCALYIKLNYGSRRKVRDAVAAARQSS